MPTFNLTIPVQAYGEEITELVLPDRAKGKHIRHMTGKEALADILDMTAALAEVPPSTIDQVDTEDLFPIIEFVTGFLDRGVSRKKPSAPRRK